MLFDSLGFCPEASKKEFRMIFIVERVESLASPNRRMSSAKNKWDIFVLPPLTLKGVQALETQASFMNLPRQVVKADDDKKIG